MGEGSEGEETERKGGRERERVWARATTGEREREIVRVWRE